MNNYSIKFFRLINEDDQFQFDSCCQARPDLETFDEIQAQLVDLIKIRNPYKKLDANELKEKIEEHLNGIELAEYGVWVYYPWKNCMVHLLDKAEFLEVKTNRNKNKITEAEQDILLTKKVGVIGLSVGQSVATTLAIERCMDEIRLADFDTLDLSNCNRLKNGVHNIGLPKAIITAREILELDPFIKVKCFTDGILDSNIDSFIIEGGRLDIIIEECDSLDIKVLARVKAQENKIPLVMEMSDKGMIDIERYDLEPAYKMFHGRMENLDCSLETLRSLTPPEKMQYLYTMISGEMVSPRLLASAQEVGKTLLTWPQLASAVVMGGGICADTVRRIFLNQFTKSGRYYVDLETLIPQDN